ncbi:rod shape-determining protein RodA [Patescibacteria group bacterium]|nr:rod shape-determining protein RodA [Patescibacteria group bacterium]
MNNLFSDLQTKLSRFDFWLVALAGVLIAIGLFTQHSVQIAGQGIVGDIVNRQILALIIGFALMVTLTSTDYRLLGFVAPLFFPTILGLLGAVLILGDSVRGSVRWFEIGGYQIQPSEIAKPLLILFFAFFLQWGQKRLSDLKLTILALLLLIPILGLILMEPDLGSVLLFGAVWLFILWFGLQDPKPLIALILIALLLAPLAYMRLSDYQKVRLTSFANPQQDPLGSGYNAIQATIAIGAGGVWGRQWGQGTQSHLRFLPDQHTDFIFATFAEEQGFAGCLILLFAYVLFFWRLLINLNQTKNHTGKTIIGGILAMFLVQFTVNIGMNIGLLPITGIPLPFISYGGSSLVTALALVGLVESVVSHQS